MTNERLLKRFDTFIFDWDGTISKGLFLRRLNEMVNPFWIYKEKKSIMHIDKYSVEMPKNTNTILGREIRHHIKEKEIENRLLAMVVEMSVRFFSQKLQRDAIEVLQELKKDRANVALFTNGAQYRVLKEITHFHLEKYFDVTLSAQDVNALKPNPLGLNTIIKELKANKKKTIYIGDMVNDIETAKYANVSSCGISHGFATYEDLEGAKPDYLFRSMEEFRMEL